MPDSDCHCSTCRRQFEEKDYVASISAEIMGDTCTDVFYWCAGCASYTIYLYRDVFTGPETANASDPIPKDEGDRRLAMIHLCPEPSDGRCRCEGHRAYFSGWLD